MWDTKQCCEDTVQLIFDNLVIAVSNFYIQYIDTCNVIGYTDNGRIPDKPFKMDSTASPKLHLHKYFSYLFSLYNGSTAKSNYCIVFTAYVYGSTSSLL